jgi:alkylated DNA nucleotide flippase Atl1
MNLTHFQKTVYAELKKIPTGKIGNYSGGEGTKTKNALLVSEGVLFLDNGKINPKCFVK